MPAALPGARASGGVGPHGATKYHFDPRQPEHDEAPAVLRRRGPLRRVHPGLPQGDPARLRREGPEDQQPAQLRRGGSPAAQPFECDNPMDLQFGRGRQLLPADVRRRLLRRQPRRGMYRFEYVKGQRAPQRRAQRRRRPTARAADRRVLERGLAAIPDPADSIRFAWDFDGDGTIDSIDPTRRFTYTANGVYTARLTVTDSSGKTDLATTTDHRRQHRADGHDRHAARRRLLRVRARTSRSR